MVATLPLRDDRLIHRPSPAEVAGSQLTAFMRHCEQETGRTFADHAAFHRFSVDDFRTFWLLFLDWSNIRYEGSTDPACAGDEIETAEFFPNVRLNYVENLLAGHPERDDEPAVIGVHAEGATVRVSRADLRRQVTALAAAFAARGVGVDDRVAAISASTEQLVIAGLGALSVGATLSNASPDMGVDSILARFTQLAPTVLFLGSARSSRAADDGEADRIQRIVTALPSVRFVVLLDELLGIDARPVAALALAELVTEGADAAADFRWPQLPFNHPVFMLFSSGTTGAPKCIVHTAGGVLLETRKEHVLHQDLRAEDRVFRYSTPAWMVWNWQLSALAFGASILGYDGRVYEPETLWSVVAAERVTAFGTGPPYLRFCQSAGYVPAERHDLSALRMILSTGSILRDDQFDWLLESVGDIRINSIGGGTDIMGCFVLGNPNLPIHRGENQSRSLAMDVQALDPDPTTGIGELVCANPFPSRPLGFYGDLDGSKFHDAYFAAHPGLWTQGDLFEITEHDGARFHGRSDNVLNVNGVRIGPDEIYAIVNSLPGVRESLAVEQQVPDAVETSRLVLLVVLADDTTLDAAMATTIRQSLARGASPNHVPRLIVAVPDLPRTFTGKITEAAARDVLNGQPVRNVDALVNPDCLGAISTATTEADARRTREIADLQDHAETGSDTDAVAVISAIFADLLGVASVGPDDSFFDLGGTSLAFAPARRAIYERLGYDIPMSAIFSAPRPRALAEALIQPRIVGAETLVLLKGGASGSRPIFMIHDSTGDVLAYTGLAAALPGDRPVYGVRARIVDGQRQADRTVDAMADSALATVRSTQGAGPYTLMGFSFGGDIAFEMARKLHDAGEPVDHLVLLDCYLDPLTVGAVRGWWFIAVRRTLVHAGRLARMRRADVAWVSRGLMRRFLPWLVNTRAQADNPRTPLQQDIAGVSVEQFHRYRPGSYAGHVVFVRADVRDPLHVEPVPVWRRATRGQLTVLATPGGHNESLMTPNVEQLGRRLGPLLDQP